MLDLTDASTAWAIKYSRTGELDAAWSSAGLGGSGSIAGIVNVNPLEELEAIMVEFPFGHLSDTEVHPLLDLQESNERFKYAFKAMSEVVSPTLAPLSDCEAKCIEDFPDDTEKCLNCMLKCVADGKVAVGRVIAIR